MSTVLLLCSSLLSQCSSSMYYDIIYDGPIYSKYYAQAVIDETKTEVPIINGLVPNVKIVRNYGVETRVFTYNCGTRYDGKLIKYVVGEGCVPTPVPVPVPVPVPPVPEPKPKPQLPTPYPPLVPPAFPAEKKPEKPFLPLPDNTFLEKQFMGDFNIKLDREIIPNY